MKSRRSAKFNGIALAWGLGFFVLVQAGLSVAIETRLAIFRDPDFATKMARLKKRTREMAPKPVNVVMFGSSRTAFALRGQAIEPALAQELGKPTVIFNFGICGYGPLAQLLTFKRVVKEGVRPDLVLIEVLPAILTDERRNPEIQRTPVDRLWWHEIALMERYGAPGPEWKQEWWLDSLFPCYGHRFAIVSRLRPGWLSWKERHDFFRGIDDSGWVNPPIQTTTPELRRKAIDHAHKEYCFCLEDFHLGGPAAGALREILEFGKKEQIKVAFVLMPEGTEFRSWYTPQVWSQIKTYLDQLRAEFGVEIINAREWVADDDFSDSHHLFPSGALVFSHRLAHEVLPRLLAKPVQPD